MTTLGTLIADRAQVSPDAPAVRSGDHQLTWGGLDRRCGVLAAALADAGVGAGDRVAIWLHKSVDSMAAVHAVLRIGAVYVPLDPAATVTQVTGLFRDAGCTVVLAGVKARRIAELRAAEPLVAVIEPSELHDTTADAAPAPVRRRPEDLAYLMYTSGSTGRPKGIAHTNASGLAYARRAAAHYGLHDGDLLANIAPLHFDQSTFELFCAPISGAEALFVPEPHLRLPASLAELIESERPTVWYSVPSVLAMLAERGVLDARDLSSLRWVLFGGEVMAPALVHTLMRHMPNARWSNVYGPAEVNQCMAFDFDEVPEDRPIPIGAAWADTEVAVVHGQLLVRADTVMAGYWRRPDATAAAFVVGPDGARDWYATGDLVEHDDAGRLVFRGRRDHQVKVRGHRIELEAVDAALASIPGVRRGVAVVVPGADGLDTIIGLVTNGLATDGVDDPATVEPPADITGRSALAHLRDLLPSYAAPTRLVSVSTLPETSNGKVDRSAAAELVLEHTR